MTDGLGEQEGHDDYMEAHYGLGPHMSARLQVHLPRRGWTASRKLVRTYVAPFAAYTGRVVCLGSRVDGLWQAQSRVRGTRRWMAAGQGSMLEMMELVEQEAIARLLESGQVG